MMSLQSYDIAVPLLIIILVTSFCFIPGSSLVYTANGSCSGIFKKDECSGTEKPTNTIKLAEADISLGMTKTEVYEIKGTPDKVKRPSVEESREVWVYRCMNSEGFHDDCLYLFFEDDRLVKIDDL